MTRAALAARIAEIHPTVKGIAIMVLATGLFAGMHTTVRYVATDLQPVIHPFEIAFFRNLFGFLFFVPWMMRVGMVVLRTRRIGMHLFRGSVNSISMLCWFSGLALMPLADATALSLAAPLFVTLGAIAFLGERVRLPRWVALAVGAAGVLVLVRPGFQEVNIGIVLVLASTVTVAASKLCAKSLTRTDDTATIVAYLSLMMTPVALAFAVFVWQWPTLEQLFWLAVMGVLGSCGHLCTVKAYKFAEVSAVEPIGFVRLIWAAALGYVVFVELPDFWVWVGGALIVGASTYMAHREGAERRAKKAAEAAGG